MFYIFLFYKNKKHSREKSYKTSYTSYTHPRKTDKSTATYDGIGCALWGDRTLPILGRLAVGLECQKRPCFIWNIGRFFVSLRSNK
jgi:hypothetical protein